MKKPEFTPRRHQLEGFGRIIPGLEFSAGRVVPPEGIRGNGVGATGVGKSKLSAMVANRLEPHGRTITFMPTVHLVMQTIEAWQEVGHHNPMVAVAGIDDAAWLAEHGVRGTTKAHQLVEWARSGPVSVFATYASLAMRPDPADPTRQRRVPGPIEQALHGDAARGLGAAMEPFGLLIADEAHVTSGELGKPWAAVHDNDRIPAARRLYLTATPRVWAMGAPGRQTAETTEAADVAAEEVGEDVEQPAGRLVASMDNPKIFGERLWTLSLSEAIDRDILAKFVIDVLEIRDPDALDPSATPEEVRGRRLAAAQTALLQHMVRTDMRTCISFHPRVLEAAAMARNLPATAAELHAREPETYPRPERVWADFLYGEHGPRRRGEVLRQFADGVDSVGYDTELAVLCNAKVLGVGVDITGRRGVDGVFFAEVRGAPNDIVQAIGRALRQRPGQGKTARIIVPVYLAPGERPDSMFASASYQPLVDLLQGLRAHDSEMVEQLAARQRSGPKTKPLVDEADAHGRDGGEADESAEESEEARRQRLVIEFASPRSPESIADLVRTRVLRPEPVSWLTGLQAARAWYAEHDNLLVPRDATITLPDGRVYPVGVWVATQRATHAAGDLPKWRIDLLDEIGMVWNVPDAAWQETLVDLRATVAEFGTLAVPRSTVVNNRQVGMLMANLRRPGGLGTDPERAEQRRRDLTAIDPDWDCPWDLGWQRMYVAVRAFAQHDGRLADLTEQTTAFGEPVLRWITRQLAGWDTLTKAQRERLAQLGITPRAQIAPAKEKKPRRARIPWPHYIAAAAQYRDREGHLIIPRPHVEKIEIDGELRRIPIGSWRANLRQRRDKITSEQAADLTTLGMELA